MATPLTFTLGKYEIIGLLGHSGNAIFYKAYHRDIDRYLAIKIFRPQTAIDPQFGERFKTEARAIARLQHPYIVPLFDFGNEEDTWFLATAYVQGGSLEKLIASKRLTLRQVDKMLREIVSALDYAHRKGVTHKSIKPTNILVDSEGHALLADFGIFNITGTGTVVLDSGGHAAGPNYTHQQDQLADIYALGVIAFEMLTGQHPYPARTPAEAILLYMTTPVPNVTALREDLPPQVEAVMQRVMAKNPEERYPTATDFYEDFSHACHSDELLVEIQLGLREREITAVNNDVRTASKRSSVLEATIVLDQSLPQPEISPEIAQPIAEIKPRSRKRLAQILVIAAAMVGILAAVVLNTQPKAAENFGKLTFTTGSVAGDTVWLEVEALPSLPDGENYAAWLQNSDDGNMTELGSLNLNNLGTGSLAYTDPDGRVLLSQFNRVLIASDKAGVQDNLVNAQYGGQIDDPLSYILTQVLFKADDLPDGANVASASYGTAEQTLSSLLDGAMIEGTFAQLHSGLAAKAPNVGALSLHAEHTINIIKGTKDDYNGNGRGENPGRKIGVTFFLDRIDALFNSAIGNTQIAASVQTDMQGMLSCTANVRNWMARVIELELQLLQAEDISTVEPQKIESTELTTAMLEGMDANHDNQIELVEGECGLQQILEHTSQLASMSITRG